MSETANSTAGVRCKWCRRVLTKPESIERRMGDICAAFDREVDEVVIHIEKPHTKAERLQAACAAGLEAFMQGL